MPALKVRKEEAEKAKRKLMASGRYDTSRLAESKGEHVLFPIKEKVDFGEVVDLELPKREENISFREALADELSDEEFEKVRTAQDIIGGIAIIEIPEELKRKEKMLGEALLKAKPYLKSIYKKGKHKGKYRTQQLELLAGKDDKETIHKENNVRLKVNVETVYFSPRLAKDREEVAAMVKPGEDVLVMFSGCAPYPCVIAKNTEAQVVGVEINPEGHRYGLENAKLNKLNIELHEGDVAEVVPKLSMFDRIVMPAPDNASEFLDLAMKHIKKNGYLHYYDFLDEETMKSEAEANLKEASRKAGRKFRILEYSTAGSVSPGRFRTRVDCQII